MPRTTTAVSKANKILDAYIAHGLLTANSALSAGRNGAVLIDMIEVPKNMRRKGVAEQFLRQLASEGIAIDISAPKLASLPFWRKMRAKGLIPHSPDEYTPWEHQSNPPQLNDAFWEWFGDSKVVDEKGQPLVVYHGTSTRFKSFNVRALPVNDDGYMGAGAYFHAEKEYAEGYAQMAADAKGGEPHVIAAYLKIENPCIECDTYGMSREQIIAWTDKMISLGYDGATNGTGEWVAFDPRQIKSVNNRGTWDSDDPHMGHNPKRELSFKQALEQEIKALKKRKKPPAFAQYRFMVKFPEGYPEEFFFENEEKMLKLAPYYLENYCPNFSDIYVFYTDSNYQNIGIELFGLSTEFFPSNNPPEDWILPKDPDLTLFHCGGDFFTFDFTRSGSGEGMRALGPCMYTSDTASIAARYCKHAEDPVMHVFTVDATSGFENIIGREYSPAMAQLYAIFKAYCDKHGLDAEREYGRTRHLTYGHGVIGALHRLLGAEETRKLALSVGIKGLYEYLPSGAFEVCIYDLSAIKSHDTYPASDFTSNNPPAPEDLDLYKKPLNKFIAEQKPANYDEESELRNRHEQSVKYAIAHGKITDDYELAKISECYGNDWDHKNNAYCRELPEVLYHVTTAKSAVMQYGLKTRRELAQTSGVGLGGGADDTISFTTDQKLAEHIFYSMLEARCVASGEIGVETLIQQAAEGTGAPRPWLDEFLKSEMINPEWFKEFYFDRAPESFPGEHLISAKYSWLVSLLMGVNKKGEPLDNETRSRAAFQIYKNWLRAREAAGGPIDPVFFASDVKAISVVPVEEIALLKCTMKENTMGYIVGGLKEFRAWTGDVVERIHVLASGDDVAPCFTEI